MIYITGHKNPDTDSVSSAIAYAYLQNSLQKKRFCACRIGELNEESKFILSLAKHPEPKKIDDFYLHANRLMKKKVFYLKDTDTLKKAVIFMKNKKISHLPVVLTNGTIKGIISFEFLAQYFLKNVVKSKNMDDIFKKKLADFCQETFDYCHLGESEKDITKKVLNSQFGSILVLSKNSKLKGIITKTDLLRKTKPKVILVDHNELSQSADGVENVEILEVIDHHRVSFTNLHPITFFIKPLGSTATIIYEKFKETKTPIPKKIAILLLGAIISDTMNLTSQTTTIIDKHAVLKLQKISGFSRNTIWKEYQQITEKQAEIITEFGAKQIIQSDFKVFHDVKKIGVGQVFLNDSSLHKILLKKEELLRELQQMKASEAFDFVGLLLTNQTRRESFFLYVSNNDFEEKIHWEKSEKSIYNLKGVVSRKKQVAPVLLQV